MMCEAFGHCAKNSFVDDAVRMLVQQMYKPTWEPSQLLQLLSRGLADPVACLAAYFQGLFIF